MSQFDIMENTVNKLCESLINEPHNWVFETCHFHHKSNPTLKYWISFSDAPITEHWNGQTTHAVFSKDQGKLIRQAYKKARTVVADKTQQAIINSFK